MYMFDSLQWVMAYVSEIQLISRGPVPTSGASTSRLIKGRRKYNGEPREYTDVDNVSIA